MVKKRSESMPHLPVERNGGMQKKSAGVTVLQLSLPAGYGAQDLTIGIVHALIRLVGAPPDLADVNFVLLQVDPEELGVADKIRNLDPHRLKFLEGEVFSILPLPIHPLH